MKLLVKISSTMFSPTPSLTDNMLSSRYIYIFTDFCIPSEMFSLLRVEKFSSERVQSFPRKDDELITCLIRCAAMTCTIDMYQNNANADSIKISMVYCWHTKTVNVYVGEFMSMDTHIVSQIWCRRNYIGETFVFVDTNVQIIMRRAAKIRRH